MEQNDTNSAGDSVCAARTLDLIDEVMKDLARMTIRRVIAPLVADLDALGKTFNLAAMGVGQLKRALLAHRTGGRGAKIRRAGSARGRARAVKATLARKKAAP